jgi:hypothetical protein
MRGSLEGLVSAAITEGCMVVAATLVELIEQEHDGFLTRYLFSLKPVRRVRRLHTVLSGRPHGKMRRFHFSSAALGARADSPTLCKSQPIRYDVLT